ncbi:MAG: hypothetical protein ACFWTK_12745 [Clostridium sp.]
MKTEDWIHGAWDVLYLMFPNADIPVIQISVNPFLSMNKQYEIGRAIREMGKVDILVIVSSSTVHNLRTVDWNSKKAEEWAVEFGFVEWIGDVN